MEKENTMGRIDIIPALVEGLSGNKIIVYCLIDVKNDVGVVELREFDFYPFFDGITNVQKGKFVYIICKNGKNGGRSMGYHSISINDIETEWDDNYIDLIKKATL